jgi:lipoprotein-releasing system permease protein
MLGDALASALAVAPGDDLVLIAPQGNATPAGIEPRMRRFRVAGIFHSGMYEYDRGLALVQLRDAARVYQMGDSVTGVRLTLRMRSWRRASCAIWRSASAAATT